ncbi:hypothetical protein H2198_000378 [Neophaeococcomyces mojaviensis]|uniref:Uncharacterized protein n=1 Tax=Neophaeococcomyces mojaviensis TaxID=3383035 RepID=A0ACC3AJU3_9EURO|nr:hypothetical protein H2198_000378 [Knufia sp. JES_112]
MSKFFAKLKGEREHRPDLAPSPDPSTFSSNNPYRQQEPPAYAPPPGPPPSQSWNVSSPKQQHQSPQPSTDENPPPYHDWTSVPDTALLPPPPAITNDYSTTSNASYDEAARAHAWCASHPVYQSRIPNAHLVTAIREGRHDLDIPPGFGGSITKLDRVSSSSSFPSNALGDIPATVFRVSTTPIHTSQHSTSIKSRFGLPVPSSTRAAAPPGDQHFTSLLPLFFATTSSPLSPHFSLPKQTPYTIYVELVPLALTSSDATVSIGFVSKPYPPNRQPGWHRASLAVHGDDGRRYVNDPWGGREFTSSFRLNQPVGLAMTFYPEHLPDNTTHGGTDGKAMETPTEREVKSALPRCKTKVHFVRDGAVEGGWDIDEERDAEMTKENGGVEGLMGETDLYAAVGTFGNVECEIRFFANGEGFVPPPA